MDSELYHQLFASSELALDTSDVHATLLLNLFLLSLGLLMLFPRKQERNPSVFDQRLSWSVYCDKHVKRKTFKRRLRMSKESFDQLLSYVHEDLLVNEQMANLRGGTIIPELCLYCTLRWLAGGSCLDITDIAGILKSSFYRVIWKTIRSLVQCPELAIHFPSTPVELQEAIAGFSLISFNTAINNCVGVVDGFLLRIRVPM